MTRTVDQATANALDLELFRIESQAADRAEANRNNYQARRHWLLISAACRGARQPARLLMHPDDRARTS